MSICAPALNMWTALVWYLRSRKGLFGLFSMHYHQYLIIHAMDASSMRLARRAYMSVMMLLRWIVSQYQYRIINHAIGVRSIPSVRPIRAVDILCWVLQCQCRSNPRVSRVKEDTIPRTPCTINREPEPVRQASGETGTLNPNSIRSAVLFQCVRESTVSMMHVMLDSPSLVRS